MGQYQTRPTTQTNTPPPDEALPVFGSPLDSESYLASLGNSRSNSRPQTEDSFPFTPKVADSDRAAPEASPAPKQKAEEEEEKKQEDNRVEKSSRKKVPIVFHWDHGGNHVCVCGTFNNWEKTQMNKSREDFTLILDLPEGTHEYKFYVDGQWLHDPGEVVKDNGLGTLNNVVTVAAKDFDVFNEKIDFSSLQYGSGSPPGSYGQMIPSRSATTGLPPHLPSLLQQTILNQEQPSDENATFLNEPNHVVLNHLYALSIKDGVLVMGSTNRYRDKYITTLMYKPV